MINNYLQKFGFIEPHIKYVPSIGISQIDYYEGIHYITLYLSFIHTPEHYYEVFYSTQYIYQIEKKVKIG